MKLRKLFATAAMALLVGAGAHAQKTFTGREAVGEVRIYINPGHGSWGPNNRHCATIGHNPISSENPDTTDFFESNTNLRKALAMLQTLRGYGMKFDETLNQTNENPNRIGAALDLTQNIVMSHVKCGPFPYDPNDKGTTSGGTSYIKDDQYNDFNRTLSVIAAEVEANDFDIMVSIHSNANNDGDRVNYLYFAYDGYGSDAEKNALSIEISRCGWNHRILDRHTMWNYYDYTMTAADVAAGKGKIGSQKLGVMNHSVPGYLVEGYFHTYQPARHRYMNFDMCRLEGVDYARGIADYFGWEKEKTGDIVGVVRDKHEKFTDAVYKPGVGTYDVYKPLNNVVVTLKKDGVQVATDTTDVNYNGLYAFRNLEPGDYTIEFANEEYKNAIVWTTDKATEESVKELTVTVGAATTIYPTAFLEATAYVPPAIVYVNYPDSLAERNVKSLTDEYNVTSSNISILAEKLAEKTVRRTILRNDTLYVLAVDAEKKPTLLFADLKNSTVTELSTAGTEGTHMNLSDIQVTADGYLIGCSMEWNQYSASEVYKTGDTEHVKYGYGDVRGECFIYKWEKDENGTATGDPVKWTSTQGTGNWYRAIVGETMAYTGTLAEGNIILSAQTATGTAIRTQLIAINEGAEASESYHQPFLNGVAASTEDSSLGATYNYVTSPLSEERYAVVSAGAAPLYECEFTHANKANQIALWNEEVLPVNVPNVNYFMYNGKAVMVAPEINADGKVAGVKMYVYDQENGTGTAEPIVLGGATLSEPVEYTYASAHGQLALTIDELTGYTTDAEIELFLVVDGNITKFTTAGTKQPVVQGVYAYNLALETAETTATVSFILNNKAKNVNLVLTPIAGGDDVVYNLGALEAGANSYEIDLTTLKEGDYNWSLAVDNKAIVNGDILTTLNTWGASGSTYYRGGVAVETNPESDNFGTAYLSVARSQGIFMIDPTYTVMEGAPYWVGSFNKNNSSSTFRGTLYNDKFYVTDWSDAYPGIWIFDPKNPTEINNIFAGATNDGKGQLSIDGVAVGGGSTGMAFTGEGADRKMFIYVEDLPAGNAGNKLYRYDIGAEDTWGAKEPVQLADASAKLINTNTGMLGSALHNVVFCSQTRNPEQNNTSVPAFIVIDEDGNIVFNGGDLAATLNGCLGGGMALSADETKFAILDGSAAIQVYDVEWNENVPSFTHATSIPTNSNEVCQMSFDYAGNLHCINRVHGYYVHAVPGDAKTVTTPAKAALVITGTAESSAIEVVGEDNNAPVEYYNLQGVKVANPEKGIFIKKQGNKAVKVVL